MLSKVAMLPETNVYHTDWPVDAKMITQVSKVILLSVCAPSALILIRSY